MHAVNMIQMCDMPCVAILVVCFQDMVKPGSVNQDPIHAGYKLPDNNAPGYPGFDPFGYSKSPEFETYKVRAQCVLGSFVACQLVAWSLLASAVVRRMGPCKAVHVLLGLV